MASKLLEQDSSRRLLNIPSHYYAGACIATTLLYYWGVPLVQRIRHGSHYGSKKGPQENNNKVVAPDNSENPEATEELARKTARERVLKFAKKIPALNIEFIFQFLRLIRIMVPSLFCRETVLLTGHTISLIIRTFLSIYVANMEGAIVKFIVRKDAKNFVRMLVRWFSVALPATFINSMIRYLESKLALAFR